MVTGPVSMPFMGFLVPAAWSRANDVHSTVIAFGRLTSPKMTGGFTHLEPYD
eukprot:jgi/Mesen1/10930/ME000095S10276